MIGEISIQEFVYTVFGSGIVGVFILTMVQLSNRIDINPWDIILKWIGNKLTIDIMDSVTAQNAKTIKTLKTEIENVEKNLDKKIADCYNEIENVKKEGEKRDIFNEADRLHDEILLQADKMRQAGKFPLEERAKVLYNKVLKYEKVCAKYPDDYDNGVCEVACAYIKNWFEENYENGNLIYKK